MSVFKELLPSDIKTKRSYFSQLVDVLQEDISSSVSRRKYQLFVTGTTTSPGVTSSLFQTIYDQDFTITTANPIFDLTVGLWESGSTVLSSQTGVDATGKELFPSSSLMMREKMDTYRQFAQTLLGDSTSVFTAPFDSTSATDKIDSAMFLSFKRLFARDALKRDAFVLKFYQSASSCGPNAQEQPSNTQGYKANLNVTTVSGSALFTDIGASTNKLTAFGGQVGNIVRSTNTSETVGLLFYDRGIAVFDLAKITSSSQYMSGTISAITSTGTTVLGGAKTETALLSKFIPDFMVSASMDNIIDHIASCRFSSASYTAITLQNNTNINSTLVFCRASADEFNYSSNPSYIDDENRIVVIDAGQEDVQQSFTFITGIGLYDSNDNLLAMSKVSRPIEKNSERDLTLRVRVDF